MKIEMDLKLFTLLSKKWSIQDFIITNRATRLKIDPLVFIKQTFRKKIINKFKPLRLYIKHLVSKGQVLLVSCSDCNMNENLFQDVSCSFIINYTLPNMQYINNIINKETNSSWFLHYNASSIIQLFKSQFDIRDRSPKCKFKICLEMTKMQP